MVHCARRELVFCAMRMPPRWSNTNFDAAPTAAELVEQRPGTGGGGVALAGVKLASRVYEVIPRRRSRITHYRAARYGLTRAGLSPAGLRQQDRRLRNFGTGFGIEDAGRERQSLTPIGPSAPLACISKIAVTGAFHDGLRACEHNVGPEAICEREVGAADKQKAKLGLAQFFVELRVLAPGDVDLVSVV
jgi:hypothetical protein